MFCFFCRQIYCEHEPVLNYFIYSRRKCSYADLLHTYVAYRVMLLCLYETESETISDILHISLFFVSY